MGRLAPTCRFEVVPNPSFEGLPHEARAFVGEGGGPLRTQRPMRVALDSIADVLSAGKAPVEDLARHELEPGHPSLAGCVCVHAFNTFDEPQKILRLLHRWMAPGAEAVLVDAGRG